MRDDEIEKLLFEIDSTEDKRYLNRIRELYNEGVDINILKNVFNERYAILKYLSEDNIEGKDVYEIANENVKGTFRRKWYTTDEQLSDFKNTIIYEDSTTTINKPSNFKQSQNIGNPIWCFCHKQDKWIQHNIIDKETIYFVHNVCVPDKWAYNAICVKTNGDKWVLDGQHTYLSRKQGELQFYFSHIGGCDLLVSDKINNESNTRKDMKQNRIKLTESQLKQMIKEAVDNALNEIGNTSKGLGVVAQNVDRRTSQMNDTYRNNSSTVPQKSKTMGRVFDAQKYLGQAIQNALANGMSEQEIEQVLKLNMSQNYNPTYSNGNLTWNKR